MSAPRYAGGVFASGALIGAGLAVRADYWTHHLELLAGLICVALLVVELRLMSESGDLRAVGHSD